MTNEQIAALDLAATRRQKDVERNAELEARVTAAREAFLDLWCDGERTTDDEGYVQVFTTDAHLRRLMLALGIPETYTAISDDPADGPPLQDSVDEAIHKYVEAQP